jgi:hypothetical protein
LSVDEQEDEEEQNKPHIIYRRSTSQREPSIGRHACDTSGICFLLTQRSQLWDGFSTMHQSYSSFAVYRAKLVVYSTLQWGRYTPCKDVETAEKFSDLSKVSQLRIYRIGVQTQKSETPILLWTELPLQITKF